jgi:hypothetical protein
VADPARHEVTLEVAGAPARVFAVRRDAGGELWLTESGRDPVVEFRLQADVFDYGEHDIYGAELNLWRTRAGRDPTDAELRARVRSMLRYLHAFFAAAYISNVERLNLSGLPSPFTFASNGIALPHPDRLPARWVGLFARRADAQRAARMLAPLFEGVIIPSTENRFMRNALLIEQMLKNLDAGDPPPAQ